MKKETNLEFNLKKTLDKTGKTMYYLSKQTGISYKSIYNMCTTSTKSITFNNLILISEALEIPISDLFWTKEA